MSLDQTAVDRCHPLVQTRILIFSARGVSRQSGFNINIGAMASQVAHDDVRGGDGFIHFFWWMGKVLPSSVLISMSSSRISWSLSIISNIPLICWRRNSVWLKASPSEFAFGYNLARNSRLGILLCTALKVSRSWAAEESEFSKLEMPWLPSHFPNRSSFKPHVGLSLHGRLQMIPPDACDQIKKFVCLT